ncbi:MAG: OmpA family protein [Phycisphaerae bacterium]|nr:OmpA family protein [Phycisphaerae bacterium]
MRTALKSTILLVTVLSLVMLSGCTDWKKKYNALNVEHQNLKGLLDRERAEKGQLAEQYSLSQQTIEDLQRQIAEQKKTPAQATGFDGYDVSFDAAAGTITVTLPDAILFASGKASLKSTTNNNLDQIVSVLKSKYPGKQIDVVGHTDTDPIQKSKWQDNWQLSSERALAVVRYLMDRGIGDDKIRAVGCGPARAVASNDNAAGKAKNRRVEIVVRIKN